MKTILMVVVLVACSVSPAFANLIQNGSFESPEVSFQKVVGYNGIPGWGVPTPDFVIYNGSANGGIYGPAQDGFNYLSLGETNPSVDVHGSIYQDFSTTPGVQYLLTFYTGSSSYTPASTIRVSLFENVTGYLLNTTVTPLAPSEHINWQKETFVVTASQDFIRLRFQDTTHTNDNGSYIDNVSVSQVPEPTTLGLLSFSLIALLRKRQN